MMAPRLVLETLITALEDCGSKDRSPLLEDVRHQLRNAADTGQLDTINEATRLRLLHALFDFVLTDQRAYVAAKTATTKKSTSNRLSESASTVRFTIELLHQHVRGKCVKAVLVHLTQAFTTSTGNVCEPLATDYARSLASVLSYQPHVEHLSRDVWQELLDFVSRHIRTAITSSSDSSISIRSSSNHNAIFRRSVRENDGSQELQGFNKQVVEEMLRSLLFLTNAPNSRLHEQAADLLSTATDLLATTRLLAAPVRDAFTIINNILSRVITEDIKLARSVVRTLIQLLRQHWLPKAFRLNDELIVTLVYLRPYIDELRRDNDETFETDVGELCTAMRAEYSRRAPRDRLNLADLKLRLQIPGQAAIHPMDELCTAVSTQKDNAERNWAYLAVLAFLSHGRSTERIQETQNELSDDEQGARKRRRVDTEDDDLLSTMVSGDAIERLMAIQSVVVLSQHRGFSLPWFKACASTLLSACADDDYDIASWAYLALSGLATHHMSMDDSLQDVWNAAWQACVRAINSHPLCRAACHLLDIMLQLQLVEQSTIVDLVQHLISSMELHGPSTFCDTSLHLCTSLVRLAKSETPSLCSDLNTQLLSWLFRQWNLSRSATPVYGAQEESITASDILGFVFSLFDMGWDHTSSTHYPQPTSISTALDNLASKQDLLDYLLLAPPVHHELHPLIRGITSLDTPVSQFTTSKSTVEALLLGNMLQELSRLVESVVRAAQETYTSSSETFARLATACFVSTCITYDIPFLDAPRVRKLKDLCSTLLTEVVRRATHAGHSPFLDIFLNLNSFDPTRTTTQHMSRTVLADAIGLVFYKRAQQSWSLSQIASLDQSSSQSQEETSFSTTANTTLALGLSMRASHSLTALHAQLVLNPDEVPIESQNAMTQASLLTDHILALPDVDMLLSLRSVSLSRSAEISFSDADIEQLLEHCTVKFFSQYSFNRSEVALGIIIDFMSCTVRRWTNSASQSLTNLGLDMYEWFTNVALTADVLSPDTKQRLSSLLMELCQFRPDYGSQATERSARTSLFQMLQEGPITLQYFLAPKLPAMFRLFTLSFHNQLFDDLQKSLPVEMTWTEGIAMRLRILAELGSVWPSLLEVCVYYIFETAGKVKSSKTYAFRSMQKVTEALQLDRPSHLFTFFGSQLLYTWLESHPLAALPYDVFGYATFDDFVSSNFSEIAGQLFLRDRSDRMKEMCKTLNSNQNAVMQAAFDKLYAHAISWDIARSSQDTGDQSYEQRLRSVLNSKEELKRLSRSRCAVVAGRILLSSFTDGDDEKWLEKRDGYEAALLAYRSMTSYSRSDRASMPTRQPFSRSKFLPDQLDRLLRRLSLPQTGTLWSDSSFSIASQMILDTLNNRVSALQNLASLQTLRLLIAFAGEAAVNGPQIENVVRSIAPFLSDTYCADDTIGILHYLLSSSEQYLSDQLRFSWGTITLLVLRIKQRTGQKQDSTTQESQFRDTIQHLQKLSDWLLKLLDRIQMTLSSRLQQFTTEHVETLSALNLPGSAYWNTPESRFLLHLLRPTDIRRELLADGDVAEMIAVLSANFQVPESLLDDCLNTDADAAQYADSLWFFLRRPSNDPSFLSWGAIVLGRAYAATGVLPSVSKRSTLTRQKPVHGISRSLAMIADQVHANCTSADRQLISLGAYTYRRCVEVCEQPEMVLEFREAFAGRLPELLHDGTQSYFPPFLEHPADGDRDIAKLLAADVCENISSWTSAFAVSLCGLPVRKNLIQGLETMVSHQKESSTKLLHAIVHIVLADEDQRSHGTLRDSLAKTMEVTFTRKDKAAQDKQRLLLTILLYLLEQPLPDEKCIADRLKWIPCSLLLAASCAAHIHMPVAALKLAEMSNAPDTSQRRRQSLQKTAKESIPADLMLTIYSNVDEPDSYYGVEQPPTLNAYLHRTELEGNGYDALIVRSAQMDAKLSTAHRLTDDTSALLSASLAQANLNSVAFAFAHLGVGGSSTTTAAMMDKARLLQQWNVPPPRSNTTSSAILFQATHALTSIGSPQLLSKTVRASVNSHFGSFQSNNRPGTDWISTLSALFEMLELVTLVTSSAAGVTKLWKDMSSRETWMMVSPFQSFASIVEARCSSIAALSGNTALPHAGLHKSLKILEARALASLGHLSTEHSHPESAMSAIWRLTDLVEQAHQHGVRVGGLAKRQLASVMWHTGETSMSINILKGIFNAGDASEEDVPISQSVLLSQIGQQLADARLQNPTSILQTYLKPAIDGLDSDKGKEAGRAFHTFAAFCDAQLQNAAALEDFERIVKLRQAKVDEVEHLKSIISGLKKGDERDKHERTLKKTNQWLKIDEEEYQRLKQSRSVFTQQSLKNYMRTLSACDGYDTCVLRFYALWLSNADSNHAQGAIDQHLNSVPSWKFVVLMNQLMSRLKGDDSAFQKSLLGLVYRICQEHTYHTVHHVYAYRKTPGKDETAILRRAAAERMCKDLARNKQKGELFTRMLKADSLYRVLAEEPNNGRHSGKHTLKDSPNASKLAKHLPQERVCPATLELPLEPDGRYDNVPVITGFSNNISIMNGLSAPKVLTAYASDGQHYKQLFKAGNDDLRQDAIMEQVFGTVSKMLRKHKATRQRELHVRTYKVIPLTARSGIIEFVANSIPINEFLQPAHQLYYPGSMKASVARQKIHSVADHSTDTRVREFRKVCEQIPPVLRFFFFERFDDPDEWFSKRTAYTRTTAAISMLGHVLGLGDRHCHNILLDEKSGEVIHIDLGVAFETGRVLPIPELVPFRLTRDIVDGMGATGIEGVFRRCCEFTMDALRQDKDDIMTLLNVLRYDPLYSWTLSPLRAKRIQQEQAQSDVHKSEAVDASKANKEQPRVKAQADEAGEAERALSVVMKKLGTTLSTAATVNELIQQAQDERNLATLFNGWAAYY